MRQILRDHSTDSQAICTALQHWFVGHPRTRTIAVFSPLPGEVNLSEFIHRHPEIRWCYPRVDGDFLTFHVVASPLTDLKPGSFDILEPSTNIPEISPAEIDAFFCPGLAFSHSGERLGRGKGFYDRILSQARPDALKIGVCFPEQLVSQTFSESHDIQMDTVISG